MTEKRETPITAVFKRLDTNGAEEIVTDDFIDHFRPENHLDVESKKFTADDIFDEFVDKFELFGRLGGYDFNNRRIRYDEYLEFFDGISMLEASDERFLDFVANCFV